MSLETDARAKLRNISSQIEVLLNSDTSFESGQTALMQLKHLLKRFDTQIITALSNDDTDSLKTICSNINLKCLEFLPILGLILRATNVRNAFEVLEPLQSIATAFLGRKAKVILSSEWDYIPFAIPQSLDDLPNITFIGLPASESANLLIIPLAGHELGHTVWRAKNINGKVSTTLEMAIGREYSTHMLRYSRIFEYDENNLDSRLLLTEHRDQSLEYAINQAEEYFCDLFGLALFGHSYLRAFAYVVAPGIGRGRTEDYPKRTERAAVLARFAAEIPTTVPVDYVSNFSPSESVGWSERHRFLVEMADIVASQFTMAIWKEIKDLFSSAGMNFTTSLEEQRILNDLRIGVPSSDPQTLGDVVNASWLRSDEISIQKIPEGVIADQLAQLNEMSLKTVETLEIQHRLAAK